jgi:hypothetical protein
MSEIPDSISFSMLRELSKQAESQGKLDFSSPSISPDIGDLAFLVKMFVREKVNQVTSYQQVFLADVVVTDLRAGYEEQLKQRCAQSPSPREIEMLAKIVSHLRICEGILDGLVSVCVKNLSSNGTLPSYRLVKSLDPTVRPHEIEEWIRGMENRRRS